MAAYYNDNDPKVAAWLRELIKARLIADGEVDERSITEVRADDLRGFVQCHFFAGIGGWSYALRLAGWPDDRPVWTGSCPCQGYSSAGKQAGAADPRNLWPAWLRLIRERRPDLIFGEQVANAVGHGWIDAVSTDLEAEDYAIGTAVLGAHSIGAPHIRQRLWFVAESSCGGLGITRSAPRQAGLSHERHAAGELADAESATRKVSVCGGRSLQEISEPGRTSGVSALVITERDGAEREAGSEGREESQAPRDGEQERRGLLQAVHTSASHFWSDAEWIYCRDDKWRPVEPGTFPLVTGAPARVGRLRGYGNAIVAPTAASFIEAYLAIEKG